MPRSARQRLEYLEEVLAPDTAAAAELEPPAIPAARASPGELQAGHNR
jgi:hypothetical protein